jgi:hypothetical protein
MALGATKKCFTTATELRRFSPAILADFCSLSPYFRSARFDPADLTNSLKSSAAFDALRDLCMADDDRIPDELNTLLFLVSVLGCKRGWERIQEEARFRQITIPFAQDGVTYRDLALLTCIHLHARHPELLEEAYAREHIHKRSSYVYYPPKRDLRSHYPKDIRTVVPEITRSLAQHFTGDPANPRVKVLPYEYGKETWFLVRYPGHPVRPDAVRHDGKDDDVVYVPGEYDAVVYHRVYGDLRINGNRTGDHAKYRMVFGENLLGDGNVFDPERAIVHLKPIRSAWDDLFKADTPGLESIYPTEVVFTHFQWPGTVQIVRGHGKTKNLRLCPKAESTIRSSDCLDVFNAKFKYRLKNRKQMLSLTVHAGKVLTFERDGDSAVLEDWLRSRQFIKPVLKVPDA